MAACALFSECSTHFALELQVSQTMGIRITASNLPTLEKILAKFWEKNIYFPPYFSIFPNIFSTSANYSPMLRKKNHFEKILGKIMIFSKY